MERIKNLNNVVLLATSHNVAKAYISRLHNEGLKPNKIILLNRVNREISVKKRLLKAVNKYSIQEILKKIGSKAIKKRTSVNIDETSKAFHEMYKEIQLKLSANGVFSTNFTQSTKELLLETGWHYDEFSFRTINDSELVDYLKNNVEEMYVIYSGGGF